MPSGGSGPHGSWCTSCRGPITPEQRSVRIDFANDPQGHRGLSGLYHEQCGKPFRSLARVVNLNWFGRF
jgi:hypothetical protein